MKKINQGAILVVLLFLASALQSLAVPGLQLSLQCSNVVLSWPSVDGGGVTYMIRYRPDLSTNSSWTVLADYYLAATGTNITTFTNFGVVSNVCCDCGSGGMSPMLASGSSFAVNSGNTSSPRAYNPPPMPPLPPGLAYSTNSDGSVSVVTTPMIESSGYAMAADDSGSPLTPSPSGGGSGGSTNSTPPQTGFYEVVPDGVTLYGLTNNSTISGVWQLPVEVANQAGQLTTLTLEDNGSPIASSILNAPFGNPVPWITLDTTQLSNGVHNITIYAQWTDPGDGTEDGSGAVYEAVSETNTVNIYNEISFPNWVSEFGETGNSLLISALSAHTNAQYYVDVYDSQYSYIGTFGGTTPDGNINIAWNLQGPDGTLYGDNTFEFVVTTIHDDPTTNTTVAPPSYRTTDPWNGPGDWVVVNQQAWNGYVGADDLDTMADGFSTIASSFGLAARPTTGDGTSYRIHFGASDPNVPGDWAAFRAALYNNLSRNLFYLGHGTPNGLGYNQKSTNTSILASEIQTNLATIPAGLTNKHKFRFVCLDGCSTAAGTLPDSFGIIHKEDVSINTYYYGSIRPSAFVGWDDDTAAGVIGTVNTSHVNFWQHFQYEWTSTGVKQAIINAAGYNDDTFISPKHLKVFGYWSLGPNTFNN